MVKDFCYILKVMMSSVKHGKLEKIFFALKLFADVLESYYSLKIYFEH